MQEYPEYDEQNKRFYRFVGNIKEYAPDILTTYGNKDIPISKETNSIIRPEVKTKGICPLKGNNAFIKQCDNNCAWWNGDKCMIVSLKERQQDISGKCPLSHNNCSSVCALWESGQCGIIKAIKQCREYERKTKN
ncbi:hypothetical protein [Butyrivibrio sp. YAB3001]|uniref:hypothetical protein n=1 Tax=Butyrivibrio sp. YAB3001 TaxID=1520812 RepID=UPI0008F63260|nr:hypothetical protein [Butyrivibrio sp. YAB3001]SFB86846.1 hypothetical protein SAMN02910398_00933 [Butyrivibrio sp. YAB3001]